MYIGCIDWVYDICTIEHTKNNLRSSVVPTLQVCVADSFTNMGCTAEVNYFDSVWLPHRINQHDVLWFQVCMNQTQLLKTRNTSILLYVIYALRMLYAHYAVI